MVSRMSDFHSYPSRDLLRLQRLFEYGTDEWWDIQGILLYRRWERLYGAKGAADMYIQWSSLNAERQKFDRWYGEQLELDL